MEEHFLLLPEALPSTAVAGLPAEALAELRRELERAGRLSVYEARGLRVAEERRKAGGCVLWAFPSLADALVCCQGGPSDPRFLTLGPGPMHVARVEGERLLADTRFIRSAPGAISAGRPGLLPARQQASPRNADYAQEQWLLALTGEELARAPRLTPQRALEAVVDVTLRATRERTGRERLKRHPRALGEWRPDALQSFAPLREHAAAAFAIG
ncbi:hypothetical protein [Myxococcus sp. RHSTA-1-4]|uniref:hypothetical protein n=1 Tax=Myxococcus sp. RHSTA-1-4 TaxID=2874601 RepID=UPI001CC12E75|nr:hypothetical protein [Myxococcus sp. RHSTA-1-4]MBZ4421532.1 hypothetical protein [Myxococcus sp. RHSTA-1-4]